MKEVSSQAQQITEQYMQQIIEQSGDKYCCAGIYAIYIDNVLVYIGKSVNVAYRLAQHMYNIVCYGDSANKYQVMRSARGRNLTIRFDLLDKADGIEDQDILYDTIGFMEGNYIRESLPPLNYQIPKKEDYHKFTCNKRAAVITLDEILKESGQI